MPPLPCGRLNCSQCCVACTGWLVALSCCLHADCLSLPAATIRHPAGADLQRCGAAGTIIGLLADVNLFYEYENREQVLAQAAAAAQEEQAAALA